MAADGFSFCETCGRLITLASADCFPPHSVLASVEQGPRESSDNCGNFVLGVRSARLSVKQDCAPAIGLQGDSSV